MGLRGFLLESGPHQGDILWDVSYLHVALRIAGYTVPVHKFAKTWQRVLRRTFTDISDHDVRFHGKGVAEIPDAVTPHLMSTNAVVFFFVAVLMTRAPHEPVKHFARRGDFFCRQHYVGNSTACLSGTR